MRHFETRKQAEKWRDEKNVYNKSLKVFKKIKGQRNRKAKPYAVGTLLEWFNLY